MAEADEEYAALIEGELREIRGALLDETIDSLGPAAPVCLPETASVREAIAAMLAARRAGVLVVDGQGCLAGIFTERDVLTRVAGPGLDGATIALRAVMTPAPEALEPGARVAYAVHCMAVAGYRTLPIVDADRRPVGVVTASDVLRWLARLFPEAVLNLRPGDRLKRPGELDAG